MRDTCVHFHFRQGLLTASVGFGRFLTIYKIYASASRLLLLYLCLGLSRRLLSMQHVHASRSGEVFLTGSEPGNKTDQRNHTNRGGSIVHRVLVNGVVGREIESDRCEEQEQKPQDIERD